MTTQISRFDANPTIIVAVPTTHSAPCCNCIFIHRHRLGSVFCKPLIPNLLRCAFQKFNFQAVKVQLLENESSTLCFYSLSHPFLNIYSHSQFPHFMYRLLHNIYNRFYGKQDKNQIFQNEESTLSYGKRGFLSCYYLL